MHSYAPVELTPAEMHRLVTELRSEAFLAAHPVLQASYAHYAFIVIHPFADGNGRVARALASLFMYRARSIPLLILSDQKQEYFAALEPADKRDFQLFVDFALDRAIEAMQLVQESVRAQMASELWPDPVPWDSDSGAVQQFQNVAVDVTQISRLPHTIRGRTTRLVCAKLRELVSGWPQCVTRAGAHSAPAPGLLPAWREREIL